MPDRVSRHDHRVSDGSGRGTREGLEGSEQAPRHDHCVSDGTIALAMGVEVVRVRAYDKRESDRVLLLASALVGVS